MLLLRSYLGSCGSTGLVQAFRQVLEFALQLSTLLLDLHQGEDAICN